MLERTLHIGVKRPLFERYLDFHPESLFSNPPIIGPQMAFSLNLAPIGRPRKVGEKESMSRPKTVASN